LLADVIVNPGDLVPFLEISFGKCIWTWCSNCNNVL